MGKKKFIATLLGVGLAVGFSWQGVAQEQSATAQQTAGTAMPPQVVTDSGVLIVPRKIFPIL